MIPSTWKEHRRDDDEEILGYLDATGGAFQARTVFGFPVGSSSDFAGAARTLDSLGLSYLADRWLLSIEGRDEPITVQIVEATTATVTVKSVDYGYEGDYGTPFTLTVPTQPSQLRPERALN